MGCFGVDLLNILKTEYIRVYKYERGIGDLVGVLFSDLSFSFHCGMAFC